METMKTNPSCTELKCFRMGRASWLTQNATGSVLDIGAADASMWMNPYPVGPGWEFAPKAPRVDYSRLVLLDLDTWKHSFGVSVEGDGCRTPFRDQSFDTVILGDILEHVYDPYRLVAEAKRLFRDRIVMTVPDEEYWRGAQAPNDSTIAQIIADGLARGTQQPLRAEIESWRAKHNKEQGHVSRCLKVRDPKEILHLWHIRVFNLEKCKEMVETTEEPYAMVHIHEGIPQGELVHFGVIVARGSAQTNVWVGQPM